MEVWCGSCEAPAVVVIGTETFCAEHQPPVVVQISMQLEEAVALTIALRVVEHPTLSKLRTTIEDALLDTIKGIGVKPVGLAALGPDSPAGAGEMEVETSRG